MTRRKLLVVQCTTVAVMVVSAIAGWRLSDAEGGLAAVRAGLFGVFTLAVFTLFVVVLVDFDRWVDSVRPYPKRAFRRWFGRTARVIARVFAWMLAGYRAAMTWIWSWAGLALAWVLRRSGAGLALLWVQLAHGGVWVMIRYRAGVGRLWSSGGGALGWALGRSGDGLTSSWVWLTHAGASALVRYRAGVGWLWSSCGVALGWVLDRAGVGVTSLWVWLAHGGVWVMVRFRSAAGWFWSSAGVALAWALGTAGVVLARLWMWLTRATAWLLVRYRAGMTWLWSSISGVVAWLARGFAAGSTWVWVSIARACVRCGVGLRALWAVAVSGEHEATTKRWYKSAVDSAFGVPPDGNRSASSDSSATAESRSPHSVARRDGEASLTATRARPSSASAPESRRRYVGRQVTRRRERGTGEELLSAALTRLRSAVNRPRDRQPPH